MPALSKKGNSRHAPKRPLMKHRPKPAETSQSYQLLLVFAQDKQPAIPIANYSAKCCTKHTKPQQNPRKSPKKGGLYSTQTGQSQGHLLAAVASPAAAIRQSAPQNKSGPSYLSAAKTPGMATGRQLASFSGRFGCMQVWASPPR